MKKLKISAVILVLFGGAFLWLMFFTFENYPNIFIVTSQRVHHENQFFVNEELIGDSKGGCFIIRDTKKQYEIILKNLNKEEKMLYYFNNEESKETFGAHLGLNIISANSNPDLRKQYHCSI